jgi:hypothetical protein
MSDWIIPIVEDGRETGTISLQEDGTIVITGDTFLTRGEGEVLVPTPAFVMTTVRDEPVPQTPSVPVVSQDLIDQINQGFSMVEELMKDPKWKAAAAKGRAIHDRALALSVTAGISYAEAIKRVVE